MPFSAAVVPSFLTQKPPAFISVTPKPAGTTIDESARYVVISACCSRCTKPVGAPAPKLLTIVGALSASIPAYEDHAKCPTITPPAPATSPPGPASTDARGLLSQ